MTRTRTQNVSATRWSLNGEALGPVDLTEATNVSFGSNVFSPAVQAERLSERGLREAAADPGEGRGPRHLGLADAVAEAMKEWALEKGATHYTHVFQPITGLTAEKHDSFFEPDRRRHRARRVLRQGADPGRARRLLLPHRRHPRHLRGPRLHRLGPDQPGLHPREPERGAALHPDRVRLLDRRGARQEDPAAALDGRPLDRAASWRCGFGNDEAERLHHRRPRAGVLPDRQALLLRSPRPGQLRPHAVQRQAAEGPGARGPLLRLHPGAVLACMPETSAELFKLGVPVKTRHNEVRPSQYEIAPIFENSNLATDHQQLAMEVMPHVGPQVRAGLPAAREALRRHQRLGQAQQLVDGTDTGREPAQPRRQPAREHAVPGLLRRGHPGGRRSTRGCCARRSPRPATTIGSAPTRRRRRSSRSSSATSGEGLRGDRSTGWRATQEHPPGRAWKLGVGAAAAAAHAGDRNRTSPFAFTGNKFEFRAVGSSVSLAGPNTVLNTIVAESLDYIANATGSATKAGKSSTAVSEDWSGILQAPRRSIFQRRQLRRGLAPPRPRARGLPNLRTTPTRSRDPLRGPRSRCSPSTRCCPSASSTPASRCSARSTSRRQHRGGDRRW